MHPVYRYKNTFIAAAILVVILIALVFISRLVLGGGGQGSVALVHDGDGEVHILPLGKDAELTVTTELGSNTIVVEDGRVRVTEADCPHGDCTRQTAISHPGEQSICLPHELWIEIVPQDGEAGEMDEQAVAYPDDVDTVAG